MSDNTSGRYLCCLLAMKRCKPARSDGLVDPERIGIIGFSRSCFYVMEALTTSSLHVRAASITDGVMEDYLQYMIAWTGTEEGLLRRRIR